MATPKLVPDATAARRQIPLDPVVSFNRQDAAHRSAQRETMAAALQELMDTDPDFIRSHPTPDIERRLMTRSEQMLKDRGSEAPKTLGNMPGFGLQNSLLEQGVELPGRALGSLLSMSGEPNEPGAPITSDRPENTLDLLDMQAPADLITGRMPDLQDTGNTIRSYLPAVLAAIPQLKGEKALLGLGKHLESYLAATGGAGLAGGAGVLLDEAAKYQRENVSPVDALIRAGDETAISEVVMGSLSSMLFEQLTTGATIGNTALREKFMRELGVGSTEVNQWLEDAARFKIDLSLQNVSTSEIARRMPQSVGRFPGLNKQFVENVTRPGAQIQDAYGDMFYGIAPVLRELTEGGPVEQSDKALKLALQTINGAEKSFTLAKNAHTQMYQAFYDEAAKTGTVVRPVNGEITAALQRKKLTASIKKETYTPQLNKDGSQMSTLSGRLLGKWSKSDRRPAGDMARANNVLNDLLDSPEKYPTVENFMGTVRKLQSVVDELGTDTQAGAAVVDVIEAMRKDFSENLVGPQSVKDAKEAADLFFKESVAIFGGRGGDLIRQIDAEFGKKRLSDPLTGSKISLGERSGHKDPMEIIDVLFDNGGNDTVQDVYRMFTRQMGAEGDEMFRKAYGLHLMRSVGGATKQASPNAPRITDTRALRKAMGIDDTKSPKFGATIKALELSGVNPVDFMKMLDLSDQVFQFGVPDVSQLITRRVMLGGLGSGARTFAPIKGMFGSTKDSFLGYQFIDQVASSAAAFYLATGQIKKLTDPAILKNYVRLLDPKAPLEIRMRSARRLAMLDTSFLVFDELRGGEPTPIQPGDSRSAVPVPNLPGTPMSVNAPLPGVP